MPLKRKRDAGLTMIELMLATAIAAAALSLLFGSLISISVMGRVNQGRTMAATTLSGVLDEVNTMGYEELLAYIPPEVHGPGVKHLIELACVIGSGEEGGGGVDYPERQYERIPFPLPENYGGTLPNPLEVEVTLTWQEDSGHTFQMKASTLVGR